MKFIPAKTPSFIKKIFPAYVWDIPTCEKVLYLTFDDGPTPGITDWVLNTLAEHKAKASFFCIGKNVKAHQEIYNRILKEGHTVGNHTHTHIKGWHNRTPAYINNVIEAANYIDSNLFRPPYGEITISKGKQLRKLGYQIIMWDVVAIDWDIGVSKEKVANNVLRNAKKGSIIVFHDSIKAEKNMKYALQKTLDYFINKGYEFKALKNDDIKS